MNRPNERSRFAEPGLGAAFPPRRRGRAGRPFFAIAIAVLAGGLTVSIHGCANRNARRGGGAAKSAPGGQAAAPRFDPVKASALRERALEELTRLTGDTRAELRLNAIEAMADAPGRLQPAVERGLSDSNEAVRAGAVMIAGRSGLVALVPAIQPLVRDHSPYVRASAIFALTRLGARVDPTPLAAMLLGDPSIRVRAFVVVILGDLGDATALPMIRQAAKEPIRATEIEKKLFLLQASEAMVKLGDESQIEVLHAALFPATPDELDATALAVQIFGELGHRPVIADLNNLAGDVDAAGRKMPAEVRLAAAAALAKLGRPRGVALIADEFATDANPALRAQAAYAYGVIGNPQDLLRLEPMLADESGLVRVYAASAILKITGRTAAGTP